MKQYFYLNQLFRHYIFKIPSARILDLVLLGYFYELFRCPTDSVCTIVNLKLK